MTTVLCTHRLTMGDVDAVQVYAPNYFRWMEQSTQELLEALGHPLMEIIRRGFGTPAVKAVCEYFSPVGLGDVLEWTTGISRAGTSSFDVSHEFRCGGRDVARGLMTHVWTDVSSGQRPVPVPDWLRAAVMAAVPALPGSVPGVLLSTCSECGRVAYPAEEECLACGAIPVASQSGADAKLVTWTTVHQPPPGFTAPYVLGWAELADAPVPVLGRLTAADAQIKALRAGMPLRVTTASGPPGLLLLEVSA
jgi:YbgC/YbaW family acyl-CoA thioester hydrolase